MFPNFIRSALSFRPLPAALLIAAAASPASAYLGSFSPNDGYNIGVYSGAVNWSDVSYYNAGQYGINAGGGSVTPAVPNTGLWKITGEVGGFFTSSAARAAATAGSPPYPTVAPSNGVPIYIVGDHFPGRGGDGSNLAVRNDSPSGTGPLKYDYSMDTYDFGGVSPSSITSGTVTTQFYHMANPADVTQPGTRPRDKFAMTFKDSTSNIGLQWGYAADNEVYWRTNASGPWTYTGLYANSGNWDGVRASIDLTADTFSLDYYVVATNTWVNLAPAGTALGMSMTSLTKLGWQMEDAVSSGIGGKNFFDDFSFTVPAPSTGMIGLIGLAALGRRRRA